MLQTPGKLRAAAALCAATLMMTGLGSAAQAQSKPMMQNQPMMDDQDTLHLGYQLRDCRGEACAPLREQMMSHLQTRLQDCGGAQCDELRERLSLHEEVQTCDVKERACRELRMQEREMVRPHHSYGSSRGMDMGNTGRGGMGN